jgi:hypothetical protein
MEGLGLKLTVGYSYDVELKLGAMLMQILATLSQCP